MGSWLLLIIAVAGTLVLWRVIDVAGKIWRERAHVTAAGRLSMSRYRREQISGSSGRPSANCPGCAGT